MEKWQFEGVQTRLKHAGFPQESSLGRNFFNRLTTRRSSVNQTKPLDSAPYAKEQTEPPADTTPDLDERAMTTRLRRHPFSLSAWRAGLFPVPLLRLPPRLLTIAFTGQGLLDAEFLAWLQIEGVAFDFTNDVLRNNLPLETAERVLNRLAILEPHLSQMAPPSSANSPGAIRGPLPASESFLP